ncbi:GAF domain-containing protein, involved in signal transduction [Lunatimonas lonarensis]|uniref:GAF domain-containing protein, involved in signal transduction n=1 Tax=Lunatimonas lonarensis TaxID=1232681 RepID=R7ZXH7_9BACT|nr:GAF domain-containing protein [Lunatimonas lonarensis]EON78866.1 GAF domain-containing protein, involved in signal transduction [Lunatimonas lonarensis]
MAEELFIPQTTSKQEIYDSLMPQLEALVKAEPDLIANLANISAVLKTAFGFLWVGFYLVKENELVLGPFQGPLACTRIAFGKGVCGTSWKEKQTLIVPDVDAFPGHIACSSASRSEIVVPVIHQDVVTMVLDVDSSELNAFDETDRLYLEKLAGELIAVHCL